MMQPKLNRRGSAKKAARGARPNRHCAVCGRSFPTRPGYRRHVVAHQVAARTGYALEEVERELRQMRRDGEL